MVNWDILSFLIFFVVLFLVYIIFKKRFETHGLFVMYKTKLGLKMMDRLSRRFPRLLKVLAYGGIIIGFAGMAFILFFLTKETIRLLFVPGTAPALAPVLPGIEIAGAPTLSFWHWIIAIFIAAVIHEFSHGIVARLYNVPIKSSGFAFLGPLLAAFVEPDEKELAGKSTSAQLSVFAAGPFSNMLLGVIIFLGLLFVLGPISTAVYQPEGIIVNSLLEGYPMNATGIETPFIILGVNGEETLGIIDFINVTEDIQPGETITLETDKGEYMVTTVENPDNASRAFIGISGFEQKTSVRETYASIAWFQGPFDWFQLLVLWIFLISIGVGLFNLLPLGPVDGGRMFYSMALAVLHTEKRAKTALLVATIFCIGLVILNLLPWINKLLLWLWSLASLLL